MRLALLATPSPFQGVMPSLNDTAQAGHRGAPPLTGSQLRALVREWTMVLRTEGLPPERVLVVVKRFVHEAIAPSVTHYADADAPNHRRDLLVADASQWCIEAYFDAASAGRETTPNDHDGGAAERRS